MAEGIMKGKLRKLEFEAFPAGIRLEIYRLLLTNDMEMSFGSFGMSRRLHPAILRTNKKIHRGAAAVYYSENMFVYFLHVGCDRPFSERPFPPRHYSRLFTRFRVMMVFHNCDDNPPDIDTIRCAEKKVDDACKILSLCDLKTFTVYLMCTLKMLEGSFVHGGFDATCSVPFKKPRADHFIPQNCEPLRDFEAELKAAIEGPKDAAFLAFRKRSEAELESADNDPE